MSHRPSPRTLPTSGVPVLSTGAGTMIVLADEPVATTRADVVALVSDTRSLDRIGDNLDAPELVSPGDAGVEVPEEIDEEVAGDHGGDDGGDDDDDRTSVEIADGDDDGDRPRRADRRRGEASRNDRDHPAVRIGSDHPMTDRTTQRMSVMRPQRCPAPSRRA